MGSPGTRLDGRWWLDRERVEGFVHGVFEGGGAKGVLYGGALEGVLRRKLWFSAVAGSSAGAITAAMIAAGMTPAEMKVESERGRKLLALPTALSGLRRVRWGTGFIDHEGVLVWLRDVLRRRCQDSGLQVDERGPSFEALFRAVSGIELFVAAVDLRARHLAVFHHELTPHARVADAVMASASIPVAFEPLLFESSFEGQPRWRLFVDGGVASNYPAFVFQDESFRRYARLAERPVNTPVVGFLLDEDAPKPKKNEVQEPDKKKEAPERREETRDVYRTGDFVGPYYDGMERLARVAGAPTDKRPRFRHRAGHPSGWRRPFSAVGHALALVSSVVGSILLTLVAGLGWAFSREGGRDTSTWNWREPGKDNWRARFWVQGLRRWVNTSPISFIGGIAAYTVIFWLGFAVVAGWLFSALEGTSVFGFVLGLLISLAVLVLATSVWLLGLVMFLSLRVFYRTVGVLGGGIFQTYLNTSAPPWAGCGPNERLVRLRIPDGVTTLKVAEGLDEEAMQKHAERVAVRRLEGVRGGPAPSR
jgi:predicted acylesterase/phospholipase RssA